MKIYVASHWQNRRAVQRLQQALIARSHEITVDWTNRVNPKEQSVLREWAERDLAGVKTCDLYIGLFKEISKGALIEMGVALGQGKRVWIIGEAINSCIFLSHPLVTKFQNPRSMLKVLDGIPKE
jgi:nucleoside 2-deoxyribosyltransferase